MYAVHHVIQHSKGVSTGAAQLQFGNGSVDNR